MAKRERFTTSINCQMCQETGTASWEENENPVYSAGDLGTTLEGDLRGVPNFWRVGLLRHMRRKGDWRRKFKLAH